MNQCINGIYTSLHKYPTIKALSITIENSNVFNGLNRNNINPSATKR